MLSILEIGGLKVPKVNMVLFAYIVVFCRLCVVFFTSIHMLFLQSKLQSINHGNQMTTTNSNSRKAMTQTWKNATALEI